MTNTNVACSKKHYIMLEVSCTGSLLFLPITLDFSCRQPYYTDCGWPTRQTPTCRKELLSDPWQRVNYVLVAGSYVLSRNGNICWTCTLVPSCMKCRKFRRTYLDSHVPHTTAINTHSNSVLIELFLDLALFGRSREFKGWVVASLQSINSYIIIESLL
jgi:hypothetical protein